MNITFTATAIDKITALAGTTPIHLKLFFDTEDCGCSVNGVPTLWLVTQDEPGDRTAETEIFKVFYRGKDEILFENNLKIDFHEANKSFILKSNNQIYHTSMSLVDKR
ncbi:iron-sulfur cluster biosynthesis family protein [Paenibacillus sp. N3.4]|uniref:iron-sulfur cluster biosynthesis family protein n=1 Tax=Paenibacillus sp. N3.4 TaxID=2603222 RepID=UPI0011CA8DDF|nr:iron-sulfur cluster biosynthesis family protein [Paenibacillus sp. N3.4]TXK85105.1 iron-sulfur cluster biosynthesis family protein [Paenibacillus sp. N3.4]